MDQSKDVTELLADWSDGNKEALDELIPLVESELKKLARKFMRDERPGSTLQTTALVNEAYVKLVDQKNVKWQNRAHFFAIAARIMRRILVDHARTQSRQKRGGDLHHVDIDKVSILAPARSRELVALDDALEKLLTIDPDKTRVVELRYFGGLSVEEIAEVMKIAPVTVTRYWNFAKAWLHREIQSDLMR